MEVTIRLSREENLTYFGADKITIPMEQYLLGVVPSEIGNAPLEACKAQAIVSRTFAASRAKNLTDTSSDCQAFRASRMQGNYKNAYQGINETCGQILYYKGKPALAYCCSSNGGIVNAKSSWNTKAYPYLKGGYVDEFDHGTGNTHTVGLSQLAAIERAKAGQTCEEILSFYFPGTEIVTEKEGCAMPTLGEQTVIDYCLRRVGWPYIFGTQGHECSVSTRKAKSTQYPDYAAKIKANCQRMAKNKSTCDGCKWLDSQTGNIPYAYDCEGLVLCALKKVGLSLPSGATSQFKDKSWQKQQGPINEMPKDRVCIVYRDENGIKKHTGVWLGNSVGHVVHAHGHDKGVIKQTLEDYGRWTHYVLPNIPENFTPEVIPVLYQARVISASSKLNLRSTPSSSGTRILQIPALGMMDVIEETSDTWFKVIYNGTTGYVMNKYIVKINGTEQKEESSSSSTTLPQTQVQEKTYYLKIKAGSKEQAELVLNMLKSASLVGE